MARDYEAEARELLAAAMDELGGHQAASDEVRSGLHDTFADKAAIRAIAAALRSADHSPDATKMVARAGVPEDVRRDAERWRYLKTECTHHYGDGNTEPREAHLYLEWGQGPWIRDGSNGGLGRADTFPGWDTIVDWMMVETEKELADLDDPEDDAAPPQGEGVPTGLPPIDAREVPNG